MRFRALVLPALVALVIACTPAEAFAISNITNTFTANDYTISTGQTVTFNAKTTYGWVYVPNPYTSNWCTEVNYRAFNRPTTQSSSGLTSPNNWVYKSSTGHYVNPCWQLYQGDFLMMPTQSFSAKFIATAKSETRGTRRSSYHGQWDNGSASAGYPSYVTTTHN